jgi:hypothetical protein
MAAGLTGIGMATFLYYNDLDPTWEMRVLTSACLGLVCTVVVLFAAIKVHELEQYVGRPRKKVKQIMGVHDWGPTELPSLR